MIRIIVITLSCGLAGAGLSSCAYMQKGSNHQVIFVQTTPPGASIRAEGVGLGVAPRYVEIKRGRKPQISVENEDGPKHVQIQTLYRWKDSFFSNFIFLSYAPIGWAADLISGAAWDAEDPAPIPVRLSAQDIARSKSKKSDLEVVIAPPQSEHLALSDAGGEAIEKFLRASGVKVKPYRSTLSTFVANNYDYDSLPSDQEKKRIYYDLGVETLHESRLENQGTNLVLKTGTLNVITGNRRPGYEINLHTGSDIEQAYTRATWWSRALPNTVGLDFSEERLSFSNGNQQYDSVRVGSDEWYAVGVRYLSALDIANIPARREGRASRWQVAFVPAFRVSRQKVRINNLPPSDYSTDEEYTRWWLSGGYGPEVGFQVSRHYLYLNLIPFFFWNRVSWAEDTMNRQVERTGVNAQVELGYYFFVNQNWVLRLFSRTSNEDAESWRQALAPRLPSGNTSFFVSAVTAGVSIGYRFEPNFEGVRWSASRGSRVQ